MSASPLPGPLRAAADRAENSQENCAKSAGVKKAGIHIQMLAFLLWSGRPKAGRTDGTDQVITRSFA